MSQADTSMSESKNDRKLSLLILGLSIVLELLWIAALAYLAFYFGRGLFGW